MAFKKICDYSGCKKELGGANLPFLQVHGSISEQIEDGKGKVQYRYLTPNSTNKVAVCDDDCLHNWLDERRKERNFQQRYFRDEYSY